MIELALVLNGILSLATIAGTSLYGLAIAVLSFRSFAFQREVLKGDNPNSAMLAAAQHVLMGILLQITFALALPALGAFGVAVAPFINTYTMINFPLLAGFIAGGYGQIKASLLRSNPALSALTDSLDRMIGQVISKIPAPLASFMSRFFFTSHNWMGSVFFVAQLAIMGTLAATVEPLIGGVALSYFGVSYLRAKNLLPGFIARPLQSVNYWVGMLAGVFMSSKIMKFAAVLQIGITFTLNVALPKFLNYLFGTKSEFLQVANVSAMQESKSKLPRDIATADFLKVYAALPDMSQRRIVEVARNPNIPRMHFVLHPEDLGQELESVAEQILTEIVSVPGIISSLQNMREASNPIYFMANYVRLYFFMYIAIPIGVNNFITKKQAERPYTTTAVHMAKVPFFLPEAQNVNAVEFMQMVSAHGQIQDSARTFAARCLKSSKFQGIDEELRRQLINIAEEKKRLLKLERINPQFERTIDTSIKSQIADLEYQAEAINETLVNKWKDSLGLTQYSFHNDVFVAYVEQRLKSVAEQIETGKDMLWDKTIKSLSEFQTMGKHVLEHVKKCLLSGERAQILEAHDIITQLAVDGGAFCANGLYDVVTDAYTRYVLPKLTKENASNFTAENKMAIYLQNERGELFNSIYDFVKKNELICAAFPDVDFEDRHIYSAIVKGVNILNLNAKFNADSDLSNNQRGFIAKMAIDLISYAIARIMMVLDHGYSPDNIINEMNKQHDVDSSVFKVNECFLDWVKTFKDPALRDKILSDMTNTDAEVNRIYALMLYDYGVVDLTWDENKQQVGDILAQAAAAPYVHVPPVQPEAADTINAVIGANQPTMRFSPSPTATPLLPTDVPAANHSTPSSSLATPHV